MKKPNSISNLLHSLGGEILSNDFENIDDLNTPLGDQLNSLDEDSALIDFNNHFSLYIGWIFHSTPSKRPGFFRIWVVQHYNWEHKLLVLKCYTFSSLKKGIKKAHRFIKKKLKMSRTNNLIHSLGGKILVNDFENLDESKPFFDQLASCNKNIVLVNFNNSFSTNNFSLSIDWHPHCKDASTSQRGIFKINALHNCHPQDVQLTLECSTLKDLKRDIKKAHSFILQQIRLEEARHPNLLKKDDTLSILGQINTLDDLMTLLNIKIKKKKSLPILSVMLNKNSAFLDFKDNISIYIKWRESNKSYFLIKVTQHCPSSIWDDPLLQFKCRTFIGLKKALKKIYNFLSQKLNSTLY